MRTLAEWFLCKIGAHKRYIDEMGCVFFEACERCNWVGRQHDYMNEKIYGVPYRTRVDHDTCCMDLMNEVNAVLHDAGIELQFVLEEKHNYPEYDYLDYSFMASEELVQE